METTKRFFGYLCVVLMMLPVAFFSACSSDDDEDAIDEYYDEETGDLTGYYRSEPMASFDGTANMCRVLYFKSSNTLIDYTDVADAPYWDNGGTSNSVPPPNHYGWYYKKGTNRSYTYVVEGNKLYITDGSIWTIYDNGKRLNRDGFSEDSAFSRW